MTDVFAPAFVVLAFLAGGLVKGVVGMGMPLAALPILLLTLDVRTAVQVMALPLVVSNFVQGLEGGDTIGLARRLSPVLASVVVGVVGGAMIGARMDERTILIVVGLLVCVMAALSARPARIVIAPAQERWIGPIVGLVSGVLGGLAALFGPLLAIYLVGLRLDRDRFVKAVAVLYFFASGTLLVLSSGALWRDPTILLWSLAGLVPLFGGMRLGRYLRERIDPERFRMVVLGVIMLSGLNMLRSGLGW